MDLQFLCDFAEPVVIAICLCIGYVIKSSLASNHGSIRCNYKYLNKKRNRC